jgi:hypothetical protein
LLNSYTAIFDSMKRVLAIILCLMFLNTLQAQYYYNDIVGTQQANQQYKLFIANQLKKVTAVSFEGNSQPSTDFALEQTIDDAKQMVVTRSKSIASGEAFFKSYYKGNRVLKTVDSNSNAINTALYEYDNLGRVKTITSTNKDFDGTLISTEKHTWSYNDQGQPEAMVKVKNANDTTFVTFKFDEAGNVGEEIWKRNNRITETYYYYYNDRQKLSDIVRFNKKAKRMLPDFVIEYDDKGKITQLTQAQVGSANYLVWKYLYNPQGLKDKEFVYNKQKEFLGRIEYKYQ